MFGAGARTVGVFVVGALTRTVGGPTRAAVQHDPVIIFPSADRVCVALPGPVRMKVLPWQVQVCTGAHKGHTLLSVPSGRMVDG
jgi:hypothetical protein